MDSERALPELVGQNVTDLRKAAGLTQAELGEAMTVLGFPWSSRQTVVEVEAGRRPVTLEELFALAAFFEMPPSALMVAPGSAVASTSVKIAGRMIRLVDLFQWVHWWPGNEPAPPPVRRAIDALVGAMTRPWARVWRRDGGGPGAAYIKAREKALTNRSKWPGPTYLTTDKVEGRLARSAAIRPWGASSEVMLEAGVPYVARDDAEAGNLRAAEKEGWVRRVERHAAKRLHRKGKKR